MRTHNKRTRVLIIVAYIVVLLCVLFPLLSLSPCAAVYPNTGSNMPKVVTPSMLLQQGIPDNIPSRTVEGLYVQGERGLPYLFTTQPYGAVYSNADQPISESTIPSNLVSPLLSSGWYGENTNNMMGRFVGNTVINGRQYYSFNLALNFNNIPMTEDYTNFEIYFHIRNCFWEDGSVSTPGETTISNQLRIDSANAQLIGMGYHNGDYFVNVGSTKVTRNGNDWVRINMTVPNSQLYLVDTLQITLNGTPYTTESAEKNGVLYLDFDFSSLVIYPTIFDANSMTTDKAYNLFYQLIYGDFVPSGDVYQDLLVHAPDLNTVEGVGGFFSRGINFISLKAADLYMASNFITSIGQMNVYIHLLLTFGLFVMVVKVVLFR